MPFSGVAAGRALGEYNMRFMKGLIGVALLLGMAAAAGAYIFPSTNQLNMQQGHQYVYQIPLGTDNPITLTVGSASNWLTLKFVNPMHIQECYEIRSDGDTSQSSSIYNFNPSFQDLYPYLCLTNASEAYTINAYQYVEVRSVFGTLQNGTYPYAFNWTRFNINGSTMNTTGIPETGMVENSTGGNTTGNQTGENETNSTTRAAILLNNSVPGKGIGNATGLLKTPPNAHFASGTGKH